MDDAKFAPVGDVCEGRETTSSDNDKDIEDDGECEDDDFYDDSKNIGVNINEPGGRGLINKGFDSKDEQNDEVRNEWEEEDEDKSNPGSECCEDVDDISYASTFDSARQKEQTNCDDEYKLHDDDVIQYSLVGGKGDIDEGRVRSSNDIEFDIKDNNLNDQTLRHEENDEDSSPDGIEGHCGVKEPGFSDVSSKETGNQSTGCVSIKEGETAGTDAEDMSFTEKNQEDNVALKEVEDNTLQSKECDTESEKSDHAQSNGDIIVTGGEVPPSRFTRLLQPYASFLVHHPFVVVLITIVVIIFSIVMGIVEGTGAKPIPDFSNPLKGVEARGTMLSSRFMALQNLNNYVHPTNHTKRRSILTIVDLPLEGDPYNLEKFIESFVLVYEHEDKKDLFPYMGELCTWYKEKVESLANYNNYVRFVHHIPNYIAWLGNKSSCELITPDDTKNFISLTTACVGYYINNTYFACKMDSSSCALISEKCLKVNSRLTSQKRVATIFFNLFHFLAGKSFASHPTVLKTTMVAAVLKKIEKVEENLFLPLYESELADISEAKFDGIKLVAFSFWGFKQWMFGEQLIVQCFYCFIAVILVVLLTWFYSKSFFIGFTTFFCILISLIISYFIYGRIFDLEFFPFVNINTLIFIIGIGADDVFVYTQIWREAQQVYKIREAEQHVEYLIKWTTYSLRHAIVAMLVTSLTTAVSFFSNLTSSVTAVKCFGLYSATTIIVNYLLMITYLPCAVIVHELYLSKWMHKCFPRLCRSYPLIPKALTETTENTEEKPKQIGLRSLTKLLGRLNKFLFLKLFPELVCRFKYINIITLSVLGIASCIVVFFTPGLHPPVGGKMQLFQSRTSLEKYDMVYKSKFIYSQSSGRIHVDAYFVFGVAPVDNGSPFDPDDAGTLEFKDPLKLSHLQGWLMKFCNDVQSANFYRNSVSCAQVQTFHSLMTQNCTHKIKRCCRKASISSSELLICLKIFLVREAQQNRTGIVPVFDKSDNSTLKALILTVTTKYVYTLEYNYNRDATQSLEDWTTNEMRQAPSTFKGWWAGQFNFFDLQHSLDSGTFMSVGCAVASALAVILFTSMNYILSIYSVITIAVIITMTIGSLVLDGWHLNIIESSVFSVAAGLSADFTLHYSVAYRSSSRRDTRTARVTRSLEHVGAPIIMGAITTFIGGLVMMPSSIRGFVQIGQFLMLVMMFSWIYSTFFFLPLLASIGPRGYSGDMRCGKRKKKNKMEKRVIEEESEFYTVDNVHAT